MKTMALAWMLALPGLLLAPIAASAQTAVQVEVSVAVSCSEATFGVTFLEGVGPYALLWSFGDGETLQVQWTAGGPLSTVHAYPDAGEYAWSLAVTDPASQAVVAEAGGSVQIGPSVDLSSDPFPPLIYLQDGQATVTFTASAEGGEPPYTYVWDLDGDSLPDAGGDPAANTASFTYTAGAKTTASVEVTDACGLTASDSLPVVSVDPAVTCHPMAQRIADAASLLFPAQSSTTYTCEDIYAWFTGPEGEPNLGFGRMWHAIQLAEVLPELTWEEILQWQLDQSGWGTLLQIDRYASALTDVSTADWVRLVLSGEIDAKDVRTALRTAVIEGVDPSDVLDRLAAGANPGELKQLYSTAEDLQLDPAELDELLALGLSLAEIRHADRLADRLGADWLALATEHAAGASWGEILDPSGKHLDGAEAQEQERNQERHQEQNQEQENRQLEAQAEHRLRTAERLAEKYDVPVGTILSLLDGACQGDWGCVSAQFQAQTGHDKGGKPK
jgi:PKD repeat protein